ncbi:sulfate ABC transporter ATP-binding protein [Deltaproteobacteria bacterium TL4]
MSIELHHINKRFGNFSALNEINLTIPDGELVALLGPSGCGKTTLLRIIAGLEQQDSGEVILQGESATCQSVKDRQVGFVFQHYALFRHMTIFENVAFGLRVKQRAIRLSRLEIRDKVKKLLEMVQLDWLADHYPSQLSGGQRQRIALARALAVEPRVLLLDEPFAALDAQVRKELRRWLRRLHDDLHVTSVFVTHDQEEAMEVADQIVVMNHGNIEQIGTPDEVYEHPVNPFVYQFLGDVNLFHGRVHQGQVDIGIMRIEVPEYSEAPSAPIVGYVRPHDMVVSRTTDAKHSLSAEIQDISTIGPIVRLELKTTMDQKSLEAILSRDDYQSLKLRRGEIVFVLPRRVKFFLEEKVKHAVPMDYQI